MVRILGLPEDEVERFQSAFDLIEDSAANHLDCRVEGAFPRLLFVQILAPSRSSGTPIDDITSDSDTASDLNH